MVRLVFLGRLEDSAGTAEMTVPGTSLAMVLADLPEGLAAVLGSSKVRVAVNGVLVGSEDCTLADGDEVAFLPPVSGG